MKSISFVLLLTLTVTSLFGNPIEPAPADKAVVYIMRPSSTGVLINFTFYDDDQIIGKFNGQKYMRYECEPGEHIFWARSENRHFVKADLEAGKMYMIEAIPVMGMVKAGVYLKPINPDQTKMKKFQKLVERKPAEEFDEATLDNLNKDMSAVTERGAARLEKVEEGERNYAVMASTMTFEPNDLVFVKKEKPKKPKKAKKKKEKKSKA